MTGADLAAKLDAFLAANPHISKWRVGMYVHGGRHGVRNLRLTANPRPSTIAKVKAVIENPPEELHKRHGGGRRPGCQPSPNAIAGLKRSNRQRAIARMEAGLPLGGGQGTKLTQMALEKLAATQRRYDDPLEQALMKLRRDRRVVYRASIYGGPHDRFYISGKGRETVSADEIMAMAG